MEISINTPALLFPAISLLMLAYTNRFLALASLIRNLHSSYKDHADKNGVLKQIKNLRLRLRLIRQMQLFSVLSLFLCVLSMFFVYERIGMWANFLFACSWYQCWYRFFCPCMKFRSARGRWRLNWGIWGVS